MCLYILCCIGLDELYGIKRSKEENTTVMYIVKEQLNVQVNVVDFENIQLKVNSRCVSKQRLTSPTDVTVNHYDKIGQYTEAPAVQTV